MSIHYPSGADADGSDRPRPQPPRRPDGKSAWFTPEHNIYLEALFGHPPGAVLQLYQSHLVGRAQHILLRNRDVPPPAYRPASRMGERVALLQQLVAEIGGGDGEPPGYREGSRRGSTVGRQEHLQALLRRLQRSVAENGDYVGPLDDRLGERGQHEQFQALLRQLQQSVSENDRDADVEPPPAHRPKERRGSRVIYGRIGKRRESVSQGGAVQRRLALTTPQASEGQTAASSSSTRQGRSGPAYPSPAGVLRRKPVPVSSAAARGRLGVLREEGSVSARTRSRSAGGLLRRFLGTRS